jgi:aryl-alcohol dehydrogenase-like predicted oxidoreductase
VVSLTRDGPFRRTALDLVQLVTRQAYRKAPVTTRELGVAVFAYSLLGRGFLAGRFRTLDDLAADD